MCFLLFIQRRTLFVPRRLLTSSAKHIMQWLDGSRLAVRVRFAWGRALPRVSGQPTAVRTLPSHPYGVHRDRPLPLPLTLAIQCCTVAGPLRTTHRILWTRPAASSPTWYALQVVREASRFNQRQSPETLALSIACDLRPPSTRAEQEHAGSFPRRRQLRVRHGRIHRGGNSCYA